MENESLVRDIENGIFNLVISLCQQLSTANDKRTAQLYAAEYLEHLAQGLRETDERE